MKIKFLTVLALALTMMLVACGKSDADLTKAATDKLAADKITGVTVAVKDGAATLTGEVADITVKTKAEASVKGVEGIKSVTNSITLKPLPPAPTPMGEDKMMEGTINENLKKASVTGVTVSVSNGQVTLSGEVPTKEDLAKAMQAASSTHPKGVTNNVTVKK
ncbi:MAG TPA: BON domain-containing protein [Pyrinomonadaceae bacterium]|nr:BON domain-containing protein [Pyrinomonadaceae bacterium]